MDLRQALIEGFEHDLWANQHWLEFARKNPNEAFDRVIHHILWAEEIWLERCTGLSAPPNDFNRRLLSINERWKSFLAGENLERVVSYANNSGQGFRRSVHQISRHVIDHGTYHRGHLRMIAEQEGLDWPETGLNGWYSAVAG
jgi:hypothetical protein